MFSVGLALCAGLCAALASLFAKLAFLPEQVFENVCDLIDFWIVESMHNKVSMRQFCSYQIHCCFNAMPNCTVCQLHSAHSRISLSK